MSHKEFIPPEFSQPIINQEMFNGKLRACTNSIFCAAASPQAINNIAKKAGVTLIEAQAQALPTTGTAKKPVNLGNYNLKGTGEAYRSLINNRTLTITNDHARLTPLSIHS
jgi:hypothetical protein